VHDADRVLHLFHRVRGVACSKQILYLWIQSSFATTSLSEHAQISDLATVRRLCMTSVSGHGGSPFLVFSLVPWP
jgi:hypothetical protein